MRLSIESHKDSRFCMKESLIENDSLSETLYIESHKDSRFSIPATHPPLTLSLVTRKRYIYISLSGHERVSLFLWPQNSFCGSWEWHSLFLWPREWVSLSTLSVAVAERVESETPLILTHSYPLLSAAVESETPFNCHRKSWEYGHSRGHRKSEFHSQLPQGSYVPLKWVGTLSLSSQFTPALSTPPAGGVLYIPLALSLAPRDWVRSHSRLHSRGNSLPHSPPPALSPPLTLSWNLREEVRSHSRSHARPLRA